MHSDSVTFAPIGVVRSLVPGGPDTSCEEVEAAIEILPRLASALDGIEQFSHLEVVFHFHRLPDGDFPLRRHPKDRADVPEVGVFATRTQFRPNPIGISVVRLIERQANRLRVRGLDALDGSPVLDLKPWFARPEPEGFCVPEWVSRLS